MVDYTRIDTVDADYFNLDDIMSTTTTVSCKFGSETPPVVFELMGQMAPAMISSRGFKTETPVWLASVLCAKKQHFDAEAEMPRVFHESFRDGLKVNMEVDLHHLCLHYYTLGKHMATIIGGDQGKAIADCLLKLFMKRSGLIFKKCVDSNSKPLRYDSTEKKLFIIAQNSEILTLNWFRQVHKRTRKRFVEASTNGTGPKKPILST